MRRHLPHCHCWKSYRKCTLPHCHCWKIYRKRTLSQGPETRLWLAVKNQFHPIRINISCSIYRTILKRTHESDYSDGQSPRKFIFWFFPISQFRTAVWRVSNKGIKIRLKWLLCGKKWNVRRVDDVIMHDDVRKQSLACKGSTLRISGCNIAQMFYSKLTF